MSGDIPIRRANVSDIVDTLGTHVEEIDARLELALFAISRNLILLG